MIFVSCSQDDPIVVNNITTLQNTWWKEFSTEKILYNESGEIIGERYVGQDAEGLTGWHASTMYLGSNFIGEYVETESNPDYRWLITELSYTYNPRQNRYELGRRPMML